MDSNDEDEANMDYEDSDNEEEEDAVEEGEGNFEQFMAILNNQVNAVIQQDEDSFNESAVDEHEDEREMMDVTDVGRHLYLGEGEVINPPMPDLLTPGNPSFLSFFRHTLTTSKFLFRL